MTRDRLLIWAVLLLLAINIATIITAVRHSAKSKPADSQNTQVIDNARQMFFRDQLGLTDLQEREFARLNRSFSQDARRISSKLGQLRIEMIDELSKAEPDMQVIEKITVEIGSLHKELKKETAGFYMGMKAVCTTEQQKQLKVIFMLMSDPEGDLNFLRRGPMMRGGPMDRGRLMDRGRNARGMGRGMNRLDFE